MPSQTHHLIPSIRPRIVRRFFSLVCLTVLCAATASAQCYLFTSSKSNASLEIQINSYLSQLGPINAGGGYSYGYTFLGTYTLKVGNSTQVTTNQLGGLSYGYTTIGEPLTTMAWEVAEPDLKTSWQVTLQSSQELMPNGLPQILPPISQWVGPAGMAPDQIAVPGSPKATFYQITSITSCTSSTGGGGSGGGGGSAAPTILISNTTPQFAYTQGGVLRRRRPSPSPTSMARPFHIRRHRRISMGHDVGNGNHPDHLRRPFRAASR